MTRTHAQCQGWLEVCNKHHSQDCTVGGSEQGSIHPPMQKRPVGNVRTTVPNNALFQRYRPCRDVCEIVCAPKSVCECAWVHARRCTCASERERARERERESERARARASASERVCVCDRERKVEKGVSGCQSHRNHSRVRFKRRTHPKGQASLQDRCREESRKLLTNTASCVSSEQQAQPLSASPSICRSTRTPAHPL